MATSQETLDTLCYDIMREEQDVSAYPLTLMHSLQNYAQRSICSGGIEDPINKKQVQKWPLPFLFSDAFYSSVQDSYLSADATVGGTTLTLSNTTNFLSSGQVWIDGNIIAYTGKTSTQLTGVTGITFAHASGRRVSQLFSLPTDFASAVRVIYNGDYQLFPQDYRTLYTKKNDFKEFNRFARLTTQETEPFDRDIPPFYTIVNGSYLLPVNVDASGYSIHLLYEKKPSTITSTVDATIPEEFAEHTIPYIAVAEMFYERGEEDRAARLLNRAIGRVKTMYDYYGNMNTELPLGNRVRTAKDQYLNI